MKLKLIYLLFAFPSMTLFGQRAIGKIAAAAFQNLEDKNYSAATQNFEMLIKSPQYTSGLDKVGKKEKANRIKTAAVFHYNYAKSLAFSGKYELGLLDLTNMEKSSSKKEYYRFLTSIYKDQCFDNAVDYRNFDNDYKSFSDFPNIAYDVAPVLAARGLYEKAANIYSKALKKDKSGINYYNIGMLNKKMGNVKEAKKLFEKGLSAFPTKKSPENCSYQSIHILLLYELGQPENAKKLATEILESNPDDFCAAENLAQLLFLTKEYEAAIDAYQKLVTNNPYFKNGFLNITKSYKALGQVDRALTMINDLLDIYPNYAMALAERSTILKDQGEPEAAQSDMEKAKKLMPYHPYLQKM